MTRVSRLSAPAVALITALPTLGPAAAQTHGDAGQISQERLAGTAKPRPYSPYADRAFPQRPLFGDTHLHTVASMDAGALGARITAAEAYRFAKGEQIMASSGQPVKLSRPLDFLVVADHSDSLGFFPDLFAGKPSVLANPTGRRWYDQINDGQFLETAWDILITSVDGSWPKDMLYVPGTPAFRSAWEANVKAADAANDPGRFTAFIGYEWSSTPGGNNLHRNVIYRDGGSYALQMEPMVNAKPWGSDDPRELWKWLQTYEDKTGGDVLAIPHNGNVSGGLMFPLIEPVDKQPIDATYAITRAKWERIAEVTQMKGDGESHPLLSTNDEMAGYETWDKSNLQGTALTTPDMLEFMYARSALKNGLKLEVDLGANPFKFGMIGSTDSHTGLSTAEEENYFGKATIMEPNVERMKGPFLKSDIVSIKEWELASSGYAAVWAAENTREAIFDAMERREVYATTGQRMVVRFFGGFDFTADDANTRTPAVTGYTKGVPMGGDLTGAPEGKAPSFLVAALRDPIGANLDRVQIVKGWMAADGTLLEQVYDVAWGGDRAPGADGKLPPVGDTVDVARATWTNTIGAPELITVWTDPDFDAGERAFYYVRVIEIPTPRWTAYDVKYYELKDVDPAIPMKTQERAYTSPIWYTPAG
jgi:hypothetical protein